MIKFREILETKTIEEICKKIGKGKYRLYSKKKNSKNKRKNLGTENSKEGCEKREKAIQFFKHKNG